MLRCGSFAELFALESILRAFSDLCHHFWYSSVSLFSIPTELLQSKYLAVVYTRGEHSLHL